jgi:ribokinase
VQPPVRLSTAAEALASPWSGSTLRRFSAWSERLEKPTPLTLCVGDLDVDMMVAVPHPPGADGKVNGRKLSAGPGGMMANVATAIARLGGRARLLAAVGDDTEGESVLAAVSAMGVDVDYVVRRAGAPTFLCFVMVTPDGEKSLVRVTSEAYLPRASDLRPEAFADVAHVHVTLGDPALTMSALTLARQVGASTSLDLEAADLPERAEELNEVLFSVDVLFMSGNTRDAATDLLGAAPQGRRLTVTTLGAAGAMAESDDWRLSIPAVPIQPRDTTGAGDAFAAAFLHAHLRGEPVGDALQFANAVAALSTRGIGAQAALPTEAEARALLASRDANAHA